MFFPVPGAGQVGCSQAESSNKLCVYLLFWKDLRKMCKSTCFSKTGHGFCNCIPDFHTDERPSVSLLLCPSPCCNYLNHFWKEETCKESPDYPHFLFFLNLYSDKWYWLFLQRPLCLSLRYYHWYGQNKLPEAAWELVPCVAMATEY